jgi:hypothetical protein
MCRKKRPIRVLTLAIRALAAAILAFLIAYACDAAAQPATPGLTLVLPFRSVGVSDTTLFVSHDLLEANLEDLGLRVLRFPTPGIPHPSASDACDDPQCATALAREHQAAQVIYGSLSKLGDKVIARISVLRTGEEAPYYRDQLNATTEEDLDRVMRRFAEGIAAGRANSDQATVQSVIQDETRRPPRRATRSGFGFRAGFLFPTGNSYGGADRLTRFHFGYKYETPRFLIETTTLAGLAWGDGNLDWTVLDLAASRIFGDGDFAPYLGIGVGVHSVMVEKRIHRFIDETWGHYDYDESNEQSETVPTIDLVAGLLAFRTYDFEIVTELRYHHTFEKFDEVGGDGAQGFLLTFGTSR